MKTRLQVMKFGGTSVGDASCILRAAQIIAKAAKVNRCVAVVSAMSGVTNRLISAAKSAESGEAEEASGVLDALRGQHETALVNLLPREADRIPIRDQISRLLLKGGDFAKAQLCCEN